MRGEAIRSRAFTRALTGAAVLATTLLLGAAPASAAPGPVLTAQQTSPGTTRALAWDVTPVDSADPLDCRLDGPLAPVVDWTPCASGFSTTLAATDADGDYTITVREQTVGGPLTATDVYTLDTTPPADPVLTSTPTTPTAASSATWSWTLAEGSAECTLTGPSGGFGWQACDGGTLTAPLAADGSYQLTLRAVDALGNRSAGVTSSVDRDATGPVVTVSVAPAVGNGSPAPVATFSLDTPGTATCSVEQSGVAVVAPAPCSSPWTVPAAGLADGDYTAVVVGTDALGNTGSPASAAFRLDRVGPTGAPQLTAGPGPTGNDPTPTWSFTVGAGETAQCMFASPTQVLTPWMACTSPVTTSSLSGRAEVTYTLSVRAVDDAGNVGPVVTSDYLYDVTPPAAPTVALSATVGSSTAITATWAGTEAATCRVVRPDLTVASTTSPCTSPASLAVPAVEATYSIEVLLTDAAGNTSAPGRASYTYDVTPPAPPTVTGPTGGNSTTPSFTISGAESGETFICSWTLNGTAKPPSVPCGPGAWQPSTPLVGDGQWVLAVVGRDLAGNASAATGHGYLLDTGPPPAPVITLVGSTPGRDVTPTWTFTAEAMATTECELKLGTTVVSPWGSCPGGTITYDLSALNPTVLPDGDYTLLVRATDVAGNTGVAGSSSYTLDTVPPSAATFVTEPTGPSSSAPTWAFTLGSGAASAECELLEAGAVVSAWTTCSSPWSPSLGSDGDYALAVRGVDAARNLGPAVTSVGFIYDTTPPAMPVLVQQPATPSPDHRPVVGFTVAGTDSAQCRVLHAGATVADWAPCTSPWAVDLTAAPDNAYDLEVRAVDQAGNLGPALSLGYELDSTAPPTASFTASPGSPGSSLQPEFAFDVAVGTTAECLVTGPAMLLDWSACTSPYSLDLAGAPDGVYAVSVRLVDPAGNRSAATTASYLLDTTPPAAPVFGQLPPSPSAERLSDWHWSGEVDAKATCTVVSGSRVVLGWRSCRSPYRLNLAGQPDGTYTLLVRLTDAAGNVGAPRRASLVLDTTAPTVTFTRVPAATTTDRTPTWAWSTESGSAVSCLLTRGAVVVSDWRPCAGSLTPDLNGLPDGTYRVSLRAVDRAGNMSGVVSAATLLVTPGTSTPPPAGGGSVTPPAGGTPPPPPVPGSGGVVPDVVVPRSSPPPAPPVTQPERAHNPVPPGGSIVAPDPINRVPELLGRAAVRSLDRPQVPVILVVLVVAFLLVQNRIDRRDPKLANAPVGAEPTLAFGRLGLEP